MPKRVHIALAVLLVVLAGVMAWLGLRQRGPVHQGRPPSPPFQVLVDTMAVTNDPSGARYATVRVANSGRYAVMLVPIYALQNRSGQWRTNRLPPSAVPLETNLMGVLPFHPRPKRLAPGESCKVTLALPFDDLGWRASFWYLKTRRPVHDDIQELVARIRRTKSQDIQAIASTSWTDQ